MALMLLFVSEAASAPANNALKIEGSWAGRGVVRALAWQFQSMPNRGVVSFSPRDSLQVVPLLAHDKLAVGLVLDSRVPRADEQLGPQFKKHTLGSFVLAVIVNSANPTRQITVEELAHVYQGRIRSWRELRGSGFTDEIEVFAPPLTTTEGSVFQARVLKGAPFAEELRKTYARTSRRNDWAENMVAAVAMKRGAIGFMLYNCEEGNVDPRVRLLPVANDAKSRSVLPSPRTIQDKSYPLCDTLSLRLHPHAPPVAREFCKFATGSQAAMIVEPLGLFSEQRRQYEARVTRRTNRLGPIIATGVEEGKSLMRDLATAFSEAVGRMNMQYRPTNQSEAIKSFLDGSDLLFVEGVLGDSDLGRYASQWNTQRPQEVPLGRTVVGVIVHPANRVDALSIKDLASIFRGELLDWAEVNPPTSPVTLVTKQPSAFPLVKVSRSPIRLYTLSPSSPMEPLFREKLKLSHVAQHAIRSRDTASVVAAVAKNINAVGFVDVNQIPTTDSSVRLVNLLLPDRSFAVSARDRNGTDYPLVRPYTLYVSPRASESTTEFVKFLLSGGGAEAIAKNGLQPVIVPKSTASALNHTINARLEKKYSKRSR